MWTVPSSGAVKPRSSPSSWVGARKAAPWTVTPSSGRGTLSIRDVRKMWTFPGQSPV